MASIPGYTTWGTNEIGQGEHKVVVTFVKLKGYNEVYVAVVNKRGLDACQAAYDFINDVIYDTEYR
jgi:hypothetical protein